MIDEFNCNSPTVHLYENGEISRIYHSHQKKPTSKDISGLKGCLAYWKAYKDKASAPEHYSVAASQVAIHEQLLKEAQFDQFQAAVTFRGTRSYMYNLRG